MGLTVSHSTTKAAQRCWKQYDYKVNQSLAPRLPKDHLRLGDWFHDLQQSRWEGHDWREHHRKRVVRDWNKLFLEEREFYTTKDGTLPERAFRMMEAYEYHYRKEESDWEVLAVEQVYEAEFPGIGKINCKVDLLIREKSTGLIWVVDHKTTRSMPSVEWRLTDLQSTVYVWILEQNGIEVHGFIFDYVRSKAPTQPSINKDGSISKRRIDTDFLTLATFLLDYYEVKKLSELPDDWRTRLKAIKFSNPYHKRVRVVKNETLVNRQLAELQVTMVDIIDKHEAAEQHGDIVWTRSVGRDCEYQCDFYDLCVGELMGSNVSFIRRNKYGPSKYGKGRGHGHK